MLRVLFQCAAITVLLHFPAAFAQNGGSLLFQRNDQGTGLLSGTRGTSGVSIGAALLPVNFNQTNPDTTAPSGFQLLFPSNSVTTQNAKASIESPGLRGEILPEVGGTIAVPELEFSVGITGNVTKFSSSGSGHSQGATSGVATATFLTSPPQSSLPLAPGNQWATLQPILYFAVYGPGIEAVLGSNPFNDFFNHNGVDVIFDDGDVNNNVGDGLNFFLASSVNPLLPQAIWDQYFIGRLAEFRQRIIVGETDLELIHLGNGVFHFAGMVADSREFYITQTPRERVYEYYAWEFGGVNHLVFPNEQIGLNGASLGASILQHSAARVALGPTCTFGGGGELGDEEPGPMSKTFQLGFATQAVIRAYDYLPQ